MSTDSQQLEAKAPSFVLRRQAGTGETLDEDALGLRSEDEHALHPEDELTQAFGPG